MALFDDFSKKAAKFTEKTIDKTKEIAGTAELKLKKKNLETDLDEVYVKLGKYYYELIQDENSINEEVSQMRIQINDLKTSIDELEKEIEEIKNA